jgi:hypothetical protein
MTPFGERCWAGHCNDPDLRFRNIPAHSTHDTTCTEGRLQLIRFKATTGVTVHGHRRQEARVSPRLARLPSSKRPELPRCLDGRSVSPALQNTPTPCPTRSDNTGSQHRCLCRLPVKPPPVRGELLGCVGRTGEGKRSKKAISHANMGCASFWYSRLAAGRRPPSSVDATLTHDLRRRSCWKCNGHPTNGGFTWRTVGSPWTRRQKTDFGSCVWWCSVFEAQVPDCVGLGGIC